MNPVSTAVLFVLGALWGSTAAADFTFHHWRNEHRDYKRLSLIPEIASYSTNSNYNQDGTSVPLNGVNYQRFQSDLTAGYAFTPVVTLYGRMSWARVSLGEAGSSFGLADQSLGANFRVLKTNKGVTLDVQLQGDFPAYDNSAAAANNAPFIGDGSTDFSFGAFAGVPLSDSKKSSLVAEAGAAYTYRSDEFSAAIPWSAQLTYRSIEGKWELGAGAFGVRSLSTDPRGDLTTPPNIAGAGGSFVVNAINPAFMAGRIEGAYSFSDRSKIHLIGARTFWGSNAPSGMLIAAGLQYELNYAKVDRRNPKRGVGEYEGSNKGFVPYTFEARVVRTNDKMHLVKIDKGSADGVVVGQILDIFSVKRDGTVGEAVARAEVVSVKSKEAALKVTEYFREVWIEERFIVKRPLN